MAEFNDSLLAFYENALEAFDETINLPLMSVSYGRDLPIRGDVDLSMQSTAFTVQTFGGSGTQQAQGLPVIAPNTTTLPGVDVDGRKVTNPFNQYGREVAFSKIELDRSMKLGQSIETAKFGALQSLYQLNADQVAYVGDGLGGTGLLNNASVVAGNATAPAGAARTADEWLALFDEACQAAWAASGYSVAPDTFLVPTAVFAALGGKLDNGSGKSIMEYILANALASRLNGRPVSIRPAKYCDKLVSGLAKDRIVAYTQSERFVRFPLTAIQRQATEIRSIWAITPYLWGMGQVEVVYPETLLYRDL